jgi:hypothetical protein
MIVCDGCEDEVHCYCADPQLTEASGFAQDNNLHSSKLYTGFASTVTDRFWPTVERKTIEVVNPWTINKCQGATVEAKPAYGTVDAAVKSAVPSSRAPWGRAPVSRLPFLRKLPTMIYWNNLYSRCWDGALPEPWCLRTAMLWLQLPPCHEAVCACTRSSGPPTAPLPACHDAGLSLLTG